LRRYNGVTRAEGLAVNKGVEDLARCRDKITSCTEILEQVKLQQEEVASGLATPAAVASAAEATATAEMNVTSAKDHAEVVLQGVEAGRARQDAADEAVARLKNMTRAKLARAFGEDALTARGRKLTIKSVEELLHACTVGLYTSRRSHDLSLSVHTVQVEFS
jgi:hypothetical protein